MPTTAAAPNPLASSFGPPQAPPPGTPQMGPPGGQPGGSLYPTSGAAGHPHMALPGQPYTPPPAQGLSQPTSPSNPYGIDPRYASYVDAFNKSLGVQRGAIDAQLASGLANLGARRDAAAKTIAALPASTAVNAQRATQQGADESQVANAAISKDATGANINNNLLAHDTAQAQDVNAQITPLLQQGAVADYTSGQDQLNAAHESGVQQLAAQQAQFNESMAGNVLQSQLANPKYDPANDASLQRDIYLSQHPDVAKAVAAAGGSSALPQDERLAQEEGFANAGQMQQAQAADKAAQNYGFANAKEQQAAMSDPMYGWAARAIQKGGGHAGTNGNGKTLTWDQVLSSPQVQERPYIIKALLANGVITAAQLKAYSATTAQLGSNGLAG